MIRKPLAVVLLLALCAACGVRASTVIPGAAGPIVPTVGSPLYLVRNGKLTMVLRAPAGGDIATALTALASGVTADEAAQGFTTQVPRSVAPVGFTAASDGMAVVSLAIAPTSLSTVATQQIACTARTTVRLVGSGVATGQLSCPGPR